MKNLNGFQVEELGYSSAESINGGSWLGKAVGKFFGSALRYAGPYGAAQIQVDAAVYFGTK